MISSFKSHPLLKIMNSALRDLPSPSNLNFMWNYGSLLGICLITQILTGIFLALHFSNDTSLAFESVSHISRDVNNGWLLRTLHANGASVFFFCLYIHASRGIFYNSYRFNETWLIGVMILLMVMAAAFMGYVLPWGQMSFWGATEMNSLFSALPYIGNDVVQWIWGGFAVDNATLTRFFAFHFLIPFIVAALAAIHLLFLHQSGSSNPLGLTPNLDKTPFHPYFSTKDLMGILILMILLFFVATEFPWTFGDPENFIPANPLVTPTHIQPEWYFLFAYAILRSIPNKLGSVIGLAVSVLILAIFPLFPPQKFSNLNFYPVSLIYYWSFIGSIFLLTWIGARPVSPPYVSVGQMLTWFYFTFFMLFNLSLKLWDNLSQ